MIESLKKISEIGSYLASKFEDLEFVAAYTCGKSLTVFENRIQDQLNLKTLNFFCIHSIGEEASDYGDNEEILIDYGVHGFFVFHQLGRGDWLILSATKRSFPLINLEIKKIQREHVEFDLKNDPGDSFETVSEEIEIKKVEEGIDDRFIAAQRLQQSILPDLSVLEKHFTKFFSYYSPEDILSGDFYWIKETPDSIFVVVADCTGHSIEGALATMTCSAILNQKVVNDPKTSLINIYEDLVRTDSAKSEGYSIGVELAICRFDKKSMDVEIATSGVPVLYLDKDKNHKLLKIRGTQDPYSSKIKMDALKTKMNKGDQLILYSDGLSDQFDREDKKKLGNKRIMKMFLEMNGSFSKEQFENHLNKWRGTTRQLDDITVIAIQV